MTDLIVDIDPSDTFDEKEENKVPAAPRAMFTDDEKKDAWSLLSERDPDTGLKYTWLEVRETLINEGVAKGLPKLFEYYLTESKGMFDPYTVYLLTCSHFTPAELGDPVNKGARRRLELRLRKLIKQQEKKTDNVFKFYADHGSEILNDN